jgi:4-phytase/acid phosphatase
MLSLTWQQDGYQKDQTPPAGALVFELRQTDAGERNVYAYYVAQRLEDMRDAPSAPPVWTPVPIPNCGKDGPCPLRDFKTLVRLDPDCS